MAGPTEGGGPEGQDDREKNKTGNFIPIRLDFDEEDVATKDTRIYRLELLDPYQYIKLYDGNTDPEDHLGRFASAANSSEWPMPVWCEMFQQTLNGPARGWLRAFRQQASRDRQNWRGILPLEIQSGKMFQGTHEI
ncbi:hypothetical protein Tco_0907878 [Tanacetum coccineum]|uniref:Uncharacterized protein n=1 Tax=Tanacetum coccineum TaxID=301880 RepID=A0ABQ5CMP1_9ASTR